MPAGPCIELKAANSRLLRAEIARGATVLRGLPEIVTLNSTDICNLRCVMCPRNLAQGRHRLEDRVVAYVCDELFPTALKANLTTAGGEPLGPGFDLILERARRHGVRIDVVTNGMLLTRDTFLELRPALDHLNVSVDCSVADVYERIRLGGSFERLEANLAALREIRLRDTDDILFSMSAVVMASNLPHLAELVRFAAAYGAGGVVLQRLRHEIKPTPDEEVHTHFSAEEIERHLGCAESAAREAGVNLYEAELARPSMLVRGHRPKTPDTLDAAGVCYFLSQSFSVMYTGEVYPCCKPTDYKLGDVRFQSPLEIWNGEPLQRLRRAHVSRRGTLFCSGCEYAPHLPPRGPRAVVQALRTGRRAFAHAANQVVRAAGECFRTRISAPPPPHMRREAVAVQSGLPPLASRPLEGRREASAVDPRDGSLWFVRAAVLYRCADPLGASEPRLAFADAGGGEAACLFFLASGALLVSFETAGAVLRVEARGGELAARPVLQLSDGRSWVRRAGVDRSPAGRIWIGEYGNFPGARCAWLYQSTDDGRSFRAVRRLSRARHIHAVACLPSSERVLVTTGDVAAESWTYLCTAGGRRLRPVLGPWAGFTAIAFSGAFVHLGTDLPRENGLVRAAGGLSQPLEYRPLLGDCDLQVRQIEQLGGGRLLALARLDENLADPGRRPALLLSPDHGASWSCIHRFDTDASHAPERFVVLPGFPRRIATDGVSAACVMEVPG